MRQKVARRGIVAVVLLLLFTSSLAVFSAGTANASTPPLQWPSPVAASPVYSRIVTSPTGDVTVGCSEDGLQDLVTYNAAGVVVRQISRTGQIDGLDNCIANVVVDKHGDVYGIPFGKNSSGSYVFGPNMLAYSGNTLKWKYPAWCGSSGTRWVVGADGNIYVMVRYTDGVHLIGLTPDVAAGQTQPTKMFDIKAPANDCNMQLYAYKDGVVLHSQTYGGPWYYSYGGKSVAQTAGDFTSEKLNADGRLFNPKYISGSYLSFSVSAYDPQSSTTAWTTSVSTPGANVNSASVQALAGGGAVALIREQKVNGGIPVTPVVYNYTVVTLNSVGQKIGGMTLRNVDDQGNQYTNTVVVTDSSGKFAIVRQLSIATLPSGSSPSTVPALEITAYDAASGSVTYGPAVMSGNNSLAAGALYGYGLNYAGDNGPALGTDTLFIQASCYGTCSNHTAMMYPVKVTGLGMDYPRGQVLTAYPRPATSYIALGDSFSSGEGVPPFMTGTDLPSVNTCHRSNLAYPMVISGSSSKIPSLRTTGFRACSGAVTDNVWDVPQANEGIQTDRYPDSTTTLVTISIGGNDIGFSDFAKACVFGNCEAGSSAYNTARGHIDNDLAAKLTATYQNILANAPNANVYVVGYPPVVPNRAVTDPDDNMCFYLQDGSTKWADARGAYDIISRLDAKISDTVNAVRGMKSSNSRLHFVDTNASDSPFKGHEICGTTGTSWFQNLDQALNNASYVFHPNQTGQDGLATIVGAVINAG